MKNGTCPKCQSPDVYLAKQDGELAKINIGFLKSVRTQHYICSMCGFTEQWVADGYDLQKVRDKIRK